MYDVEVKRSKQLCVDLDSTWYIYVYEVAIDAMGYY